MNCRRATAAGARVLIVERDVATDEYATLLARSGLRLAQTISLGRVEAAMGHDLIEAQPLWLSIRREEEHRAPLRVKARPTLLRRALAKRQRPGVSEVERRFGCHVLASGLGVGSATFVRTFRSVW